MATQVEPEIARRRFSVEEFLRMDEAGLFVENDRLELDGEIVEMHPIGWRHHRCVTLLTALLVKAASDDLLVSSQGPVQIGEYGLPQPDFAVIRSDAFDDGSHPDPAQTLLVIEVSESSLRYDRNVKVPLYARYGYPEAWIVDLGEEVVERHSRPSQEGYRQTRRFARGEVVEPTAVPSLRLAVDDFLG
ncbi:MAG: hypothetical protein AVDCRST_MAG45-2178 [uncultured Solirubrobacterales bacterium]|uniref:Putative restriction endonuclease domain-containing protein n=1 Tax=uncultured Solirubrobacterales bacterium TaxID=768556 RepID=A0A6J4T7S6_9ACTN|nr:MAG: hypothetical protein AVDCRST_MAG45-2178 [uncultured Solirubrobacterales bacterium]